MKQPRRRMLQAMATKAKHVELNVDVVSCHHSGDVAAAPMEEKNTLESREDLARGKATQAVILTKPRRWKLQVREIWSNQVIVWVLYLVLFMGFWDLEEQGSSSSVVEAKLNRVHLTWVHLIELESIWLEFDAYVD